MWKPASLAKRLMVIAFLSFDRPCSNNILRKKLNDSLCPISAACHFSGGKQDCSQDLVCLFLEHQKRKTGSQLHLISSFTSFSQLVLQ